MDDFGMDDPYSAASDLVKMALNLHGHNETEPPAETAAPETQSIPLVCSICPKNTTFSDISHLLTHVSSKGHLSNQFNLKVIRDVDEDAAIALNEYDKWYEDHDINSLLRNQGRTPQSPPTHAQDVTAGTAKRGARGGRGSRRGRGGRGGGRAAKPESPTQPNYEQEIKCESDDDNSQQSHDHGHAYTLAQSTYPSVPSPLSCMTSHSGSFAAEGNYRVRRSFGLTVDDDDSSRYEMSEDGSSFPSETSAVIIEDDSCEISNLKLKGQVFPGMAGFDAAGNDQKRMRNQKKDPAVLHKLEKNSMSVATREAVMDLKLDLQRTRDVYDEPSIDGSEDEYEAASDRQTKRRNSSTDKPNPRKTRASPAQRDSAPPTRSRRSTRGRGARGVSAGQQRPVLQSPLAQHSPTQEIVLSPQMPFPNQGLHSGFSIYEDPQSALDVDAMVGHKAHGNGRLPGHVLRPGNANLGYNPSTPALKRHSPLYPGKENQHLPFPTGSTSAFPYMNSEPVDNGGFNPLCVQPRDDVGFRMFQGYGEDNQLNIAAQHPPSYHSSRANSESFHM